MLKVFLLSMIILFNFTFINADHETYIKKTLNRIEKMDRASMSILQKALVLDDFECALLTHLKSDVESKDYYLDLESEDRRIENVFSLSHDLYQFIHPHWVVDKRPYLLNGEWTFVFYNSHEYQQGRTLTEAEILLQFQLEKNNYNYNKIIKSVYTFDVNSIDLIESGITYNFIVTTDEKIIFTPESITTYDSHNNKQHVGLNHAVIADNKPLLTAGVFIMYKSKDKFLFLVSNATGHYKTDFESLKHAKRLMASCQVPEEAIILTCLSSRTFSRMPWKIMERLQKSHD